MKLKKIQTSYKTVSKSLEQNLKSKEILIWEKMSFIGKVYKVYLER